MTAGEIREDILGSYRIGGRNGRHILGYTHMLQHTMPAENVEMMLRTQREFGLVVVRGFQDSSK